MKKICKYCGWTIYHNNKVGQEPNWAEYVGFLPGETYQEMGGPEWETDSIEELKEFIRGY